MDSNIIANRKGIIFAISAPSGAGKTTIAKALVQRIPGIQRSISFNTRPKREEEIDGVDYIFVSQEAFDKYEQSGEFIETAEVYGYKRGTPKTLLQQNIDHVIDTLCVIEWRGVQQLKHHFNNEVVSIFISPPSLAELRRRLVLRNQDTEEEIERRIQSIYTELNTAQNYDYCVINDQLDACIENISHILIAERYKTCRLTRKIDI